MGDYLKKLPYKSEDPILNYNQGEKEDKIEDIYSEISLRRNKIERKLRILLWQSLKLSYGNNCMSKLLEHIPSNRRETLNRYSFEKVWENLYFSDLILIIDKNWDKYQNWFSTDKQNVLFWLNHINSFRIDAHAKSIKDDDLVYLRVCFARMEEHLTDFDLN